MRALLIISSVLVLANARPQVNPGYQYPAQSNHQATLSVQSDSVETLPNFIPVIANDGPALPPVYPDAQVPDYFIPTGPSNVQLQGVPVFSPTASEQQTNLENQELTTGPETYRNTNEEEQKLLSTSYDAVPSGAPQPQQQTSFDVSGQQQSFVNVQQQPSSGSSFQQGPTFVQQSDDLPAIVTKHFYVHAAPEEPEENQGPRFVNIGRKQKNYKIIFIKAPTYGLNSQVIPVVQPNEEKTIVYVLSKKPTFNQEISLPPAPVTEPSKPEVFFIKYKTEKEAQEAQQKIQGAYESDAFKGSNDFISDIGSVFQNQAVNFQNQGAAIQNQAGATLNAFAGQAGSALNNFGSAVTNQFISGSRPNSAAKNDEEQEEAEEEEEVEASVDASANTFVQNLVESLSPVEEQSEHQSPPQQNEVQVVYLPPSH